jgi:hypothetical protein
VVLASDVIGYVLNGELAVAPDGSVRAVIGTSNQDVVSVDRAGSAQWVAHVGPLYSALPAIAPSGETFLLNEAGSLIAISNDGEPTTTPAGPFSDRYAFLALGPAGRLYVISQDSVFASCAGRTPLWTLYVPSDFRPDQPFSGPDGSLYVGDLAVAGGGATIRILPSGAISEEISAYSSTTAGVTALVLAGDTRMVCGLSDPSRPRADFCDVATGAEPMWRVPLSDGPAATAHLDPTGGVWVEDRFSPTSVALERYGAGARLWQSTGRGLPFQARTWTSTGDVLGQPSGEGEDLEALELMDAETGSIAWSLRAERPDGSALYALSLALDPTGRAYVMSGAGEIVALQTDALPAGEGRCSNYRCDPRRSRSMTSAP